MPVMVERMLRTFAFLLLIVIIIYLNSKNNQDYEF